MLRTVTFILALLLAATPGCHLLDYRLPEEPRPQELRAGAAGVCSLAFSPDGKLLASSHCQMHPSTVLCAQFVPATPQIRLWDAGWANCGRMLTAFSMPEDGRSWSYPRVQFSPDVRELLVTTNTGLLRWNLAEQKLEKLFPDRFGTLTPDCRTFVTSKPEDNLKRTFRFYAGPANDECPAETELELLDVESRTCREVRLLPATALGGLVFSPDGQLVALHHDDDHMEIRQLTPWARQTRFGRVHGSLVNVFSPDGQRFVTESSERVLSAWDTKTGRKAGEWTIWEHIWSAAISPDGRLLAVGTEAENCGMIWLIDLVTGEIIAKRRDTSTWGITALRFSPDGSTLASGCGDGRIKLWSVAELALKAVNR